MVIQGASVPQEPTVAPTQAGPANARAGADYVKLSELLREIRAVQCELADLSRQDATDLENQHRIIASLDEVVHGCVARVRETLATLGDLRDCRPLLHAVRDMSGALLDQLERCLNTYGGGRNGILARNVIADLRLRLVRAGAERAIWERCSGGPPHPRLWRWLGTALVDAAGEHSSAGARPLPAVMPSEESVEFHYIRALAACTASLDLLPPQLLAAVDRLLRLSVPVVRFGPEVFAGATHFIDPQGGGAPRRLVGVSDIVPGAWFFAPGIAPEMFREARARATADPVFPATSADVEASSLYLRALDHLLQHWSATPPVRRHRRHTITGTLAAVAGIDELRRVFAGEHDVRREEWKLRDLSRGGLGAVAANGAVSVGQLVGIHSVDGQGWQLALVRRAWTVGEGATHVGLEVLSRKPALVHVDDGRRPAEVLLCDPLLRGEAVRIIVPLRVLGTPTVPLFVTGSGSVQKLKPLDASYSGDGFELRVYQVL
ncbi:hypothetical protein LLG90_16265 [Aromatoleum toluclasticum]|uniref:hypothetical protein n=1 Tax=Aromatoleum toluclasticum TaxID=92003 RepID=UPI001D188F80|nr:hypothetical protein [Aromatoleum toluclasticum]MCC4116910.1 hypothetical protein [Aromatoleum toluclasticum]